MYRIFSILEDGNKHVVLYLFMKEDPKPTYNEPYEPGCGEIYNFWLKHPAAFDERENLRNVDNFKKSLIRNIFKPISLEEYNAGIPQKCIIQIKIYGLFLQNNDQPVLFHFRKRRMDEVVRSYQENEVIIESFVIKEVNGKVKITGERSFTPQEENIIFNCLARCFRNTSPFDDLDNGKEIKTAMGELFPDIFPFAAKNNMDD